MANQIEAYLSKPYSKVLVRDKNGGYVASVSEFPGCIAEGETPDEAIESLDEAMVDWIEAVLEANGDVPEPMQAQGFSGRLVLRLPKSIHRQVALRAQVDGISLNQWLVEAVGERLGAEKFSNRLSQMVAPQISSTRVMWPSAMRLWSSSFHRYLMQATDSPAVRIEAKELPYAVLTTEEGRVSVA